MRERAFELDPSAAIRMVPLVEVPSLKRTSMVESSAIFVTLSIALPYWSRQQDAKLLQQADHTWTSMPSAHSARNLRRETLIIFTKGTS